MLSADDLLIDTTGWEPRETAENRATWINAAGDVLTKRFNPEPPQMPGLFRTQELLDYYSAQVTAAGGALISVDLVHVRGTNLSKVVFKSSQSEGPLGFVGTLTLPYRDFSYSLRIQALECPGDEVRSQQAMAFLEMSNPSGTDLRPLWFGEPVEVGETKILRCLADDEVWDVEFPTHPLARVRTELARLLPSIQVSREVKNSVPHG
jgi:hypothetical protein